MTYRTKKGLFKPKNPKKYKGDASNIVYRSGWEKRVMRHLDENKNVKEWSSEETIVPYISPVDGKFHRYYPDFLITLLSGEVILIEVKPQKQVNPPSKKGKKTGVYMEEIRTFAVNSAKWEAAIQYCSTRGWKFQILTENQIGK
jgi:hypothetical protein